MKNKKSKKPSVAVTKMNEDLFLAMISAKAEARTMQRQLAAAELKLHLLQIERMEEQRAAKQELDGMVAFFGVIAGLVVSGVCVLAAPVWTAVLPIVGTLAVMRKAGWI